MTYDVAEPKERYNLEITREHYRKYHPESEKRTISQAYNLPDNISRGLISGLGLNPDIFLDKKYGPGSEKRSIYQHISPFKGPDSDIVLKTTSGIVYGGIVGLHVAAYTSIRHAQGYSARLEKCFKHGTPWLLAGTTYGVTLSLVTQFRQKESPENHMVAGYAAGTMFGSWYKSTKMGVWSGIFAAISAGLLKYWHDNDMLEVKVLQQERMFNNYRRGWFTERPDAVGKSDADKDMDYKSYKA